ncbi:MAG: hypothetical protein NUV74_11375 [Candidatus Brocadiaceae bacterium]|nr:hypothetical protein [Candidatus Brocadiaceae bacterium]
MLLILLGSGVIAYVATRFVGCAEYAFFHYNAQYYEPRDLERYEVEKEGEKKGTRRYGKRSDDV